VDIEIKKKEKKKTSHPNRTFFRLSFRQHRRVGKRHVTDPWWKKRKKSGPQIGQFSFPLTLRQGGKRKMQKKIVGGGKVKEKSRRDRPSLFSAGNHVGGKTGTRRERSKKKREGRKAESICQKKRGGRGGRKKKGGGKFQCLPTRRGEKGGRENRRNRQSSFLLPRPE